MDMMFKGLARRPTVEERERRSGAEWAEGKRCLALQASAILVRRGRRFRPIPLAARCPCACHNFRPRPTSQAVSAGQEESPRRYRSSLLGASQDAFPDEPTGAM